MGPHQLDAFISAARIGSGMSYAMAPTQALAMVPGWSDAAATITELPGGLTNHSFRIHHAGECLVLRLDSEYTGILNLDRKTELSVLETASVRGLAPEIVYSDARQGILLSRFIAGGTWRVQDLAVSTNIEALGALLRRVHALPLSGVSFDAQAIASHYTDNLRPRKDLHSFTRICEGIIAGISRPAALSCCHNDLVLENLIGLPRPILIDWEYACDNDPLFDLASLIGYHDLQESIVTGLLEAYARERAGEFRVRLDIQLRLYDALQWLWLANRQIISPNDSQTVRLQELQQRIR